MVMSLAKRVRPRLVLSPGVTRPDAVPRVPTSGWHGTGLIDPEPRVARSARLTDTFLAYMAARRSGHATDLALSALLFH